MGELLRRFSESWRCCGPGTFWRGLDWRMGCGSFDSRWAAGEFRFLVAAGYVYPSSIFADGRLNFRYKVAEWKMSPFPQRRKIHNRLVRLSEGLEVLEILETQSTDLETSMLFSWRAVASSCLYWKKIEPLSKSSFATIRKRSDVNKQAQSTVSAFENPFIYIVEENLHQHW